MTRATKAKIKQGQFARFLENDLILDLLHSPTTIICILILVICLIGAFGSPILAPHDPFDLAGLNLMDSLQPPAFMAQGHQIYPLGTDDQGRDVLSTMMYGTRISLIVGFFAITFAFVVGVMVGLVAGYAGGILDALLMRIADVQLTFPSILIALLVDGVVTAVVPRDLHERLKLYVLIFAIGISRWPQLARTVRGSTMIERGREYVMAATVIGLSSARIILTHILPNVISPVLIIATLNLGLAILDEATLSFLGVGLPPTEPSLGTLIHVGNDYLFSGEWWIAIFPGSLLAILVLSINLLGDWLRDALDPRLS